MLGTGRGRVTRRPLREIVDLFDTVEKVGEGAHPGATPGGQALLPELREGDRQTRSQARGPAAVLDQAGAALRAFVRVVPDVMARAKECGAIRSRPTPSGRRQALAERLRDRRFETEGEWKLKLAGGTRGTVELLARELRARPSLDRPEIRR